MKLINKTILNYLFISIPLMIVAGIVSYFLIKNELRDGMDETLDRERLNVEKLIESLKEPANTYLGYDSLSYIKVMDKNFEMKDTYSDTGIYITKKKKRELRNYRTLKCTYTFNNANYLITLSRPTIEEEELMDSLFSAFCIIITFFVFSFFIVSWLLSKRLWRPFYNTLSKLGKYDIKNHATTNFQMEKTTEFNQLNIELNKMTDKIHNDFIQQKEFTENASHEMQTPLAVVRANLSILMQSPNLQEPEMNSLEAIENTIKKLTSLNKTLILLAKIENNQYHESAEVNFKEKLESSLDLFSDLIQAKNIKTEIQLDPNVSVKMNPSLADILINNLMQNAIRHNSEGGNIRIALNSKSFTVSNGGEPLSITEKDLFVRFKKNDDSKDSLGLGLSIVKSIVNLYDMEIRYVYSDRYHNFVIYF